MASNCFQFVISREKQSGISKLFSTTDVNDMSSAADVFYQSPTSTVDNMNASNAVYPSVTNSLITFNDKNKLQFGLVEVCSNNIYNKMCDDGFGSHQEICYANNANESILATAINNYAICSLHLKNIKEAVSVLEDLIKDNPTIYLIDPIVFNLCTMYDLIYASDISVQRKKTIQIIATYYDIEDPMLHWRCYRLANNS